MLSVLILFGLLPAGLLFPGPDAEDPSREPGEDGHDAPAAGPAMSPGSFFSALDDAVDTGAAGGDDGGAFAAAPAPLLPLSGAAGSDLLAGADNEETGAGPSPGDASGAGQAAGPVSPADEAGTLDLGDGAGDSSGAGSSADEDPDQSRDFTVEAGPQDVRIETFRPGADILDIHVGGKAVTAFLSLDPDSGDGQLRLDEAGGERVISFAGLSRAPVDDIFLLTTDPDSGEVSSTALAEFLFNEADALDAMDPALPSVITPAEEPEAGLDAFDPELPSVITPVEPPDPGLDALNPDQPSVITPDDQPGAALEALSLAQSEAWPILPDDEAHRN